MLAALMALIGTAGSGWYGPVTAEFRVEFDGNPYDPADNDVRVVFESQDGTRKEERLAFYAGDGVWKAVLVTQTPGTYRPVLVRNGKASTQPPVVPSLTVQSELPGGFVRIVNGRFQLDNASSYYPLGINMGWQGGDLPPLTETIRKMGDAGANWNRIWACHWDGKNPWWTVDKPLKAGDFSQEALQKWDSLLSASQKHGQYTQVVLFHHGQWTTRVNPNWPDNPWNSEKGGFLKNPADFFKDAEAKRRAKQWLRYAVARYGHYPSVMAWELFNEVQWVNARYDKRWSDIYAWHGEMAEFLRSIDPYRHLVTTSSDADEGSEEALYAKMDYYQPHTYPANVLGAIGGRRFEGKPGFYGEFGPPEGKDYQQGVRDGIYGGMLAGHAGAGQFWYWDRVEKDGLFSLFARASEFLRISDVARNPSAKPFVVGTESGKRVTLAFRPGMGWGKSKRGDFRLPADVSSAGDLSSYLQGTSGGNASMAVPWQFSFTSTQDGTARVRVANIAKGGGGLRISVNGKLVSSKDWPAATNDRGGETLEFPIPAGSVTVRLENPGSDWVNISAVELPGLADAFSAHGMGTDRWAALRVIGLTGEKVRLSGLPISDGEVRIRFVDLVGTGDSLGNGRVSGGQLEISAPFAEFGVRLDRE